MFKQSLIIICTMSLMVACNQKSSHQEVSITPAESEISKVDSVVGKGPIHKEQSELKSLVE
ncbi:MAG: hypothetical protein R8K22_04805 [Mariprofundaceae bacterium]